MLASRRRATLGAYAIQCCVLLFPLAAACGYDDSLCPIRTARNPASGTLGRQREGPAILRFGTDSWCERLPDAAPTLTTSSAKLFR